MTNRPPIAEAKSREEVLRLVKSASVTELDEILALNDHDYGNRPYQSCIVEIKLSRKKRIIQDAEDSARARHNEVMAESSKAIKWARIAGIAGIVAAIAGIITAAPVIHDWLKGTKVNNMSTLATNSLTHP